LEGTVAAFGHGRAWLAEGFEIPERIPIVQMVRYGQIVWICEQHIPIRMRERERCGGAHSIQFVSGIDEPSFESVDMRLAEIFFRPQERVGKQFSNL
jgi:hypothetical protein